MVSHLRIIVLATVVLAAGAALPPLDDFLSFPRRNLLVGCDCEASESVAWVETTKGSVKVFLASSSSGFEPIPVDADKFRLDEGLEVSRLTFRPRSNCTQLLFTIGPSGAANPTHKASPPPPFATYLASASELAFVGSFQLMAVHPGGDRVAYATFSGPVSFDGLNSHVASAHLIEKSLADPSSSDTTTTTTTTTTTILAVKQGTIQQATYDPTGSKIAFSNDRGTHALVGVVWSRDERGEAASVTYVSPGVDFDREPHFSPDGSRLAWVRYLGPANVYDRGLGGHRGPSFEVWMTSAAHPTPTTTMLFAESTYGIADSSSGYGNRPGVLWVGNEHVVSMSASHPDTESDGWLHPILIGVPSDADAVQDPGGSAGIIDLIPGSLEVKSWGVHGSSVYVVHNTPDEPDSRRLSEIANVTSILDRKKKTTKKTNDIEPLPVGVGGVTGMSSTGTGFAVTREHVFYFRTGVDFPCAVFMVGREGTGEEEEEEQPLTTVWRLPMAVSPRNVTFDSPDKKFTLHAQVFMPPTPTTTPSGQQFTKGVVFTHGGSERQMFPFFHFSPTYAALYALNQYIATVHNTPVISVNYRSGVGYGEAFRVCEQCMWLGAAEVQDVAAASQYLRNHLNVTSVGKYGLSYGGLNTLQALSRYPELFQAGVANAPVYNWISQARYDGGRFGDVQPAFSNGYRTLAVGPLSDQAGPHWLEQAQANEKLAYESSPVSQMANLVGRLMVIQGDADDEVAFTETIGIVRTMRALNKSHLVTPVVFPDNTHGLATYSTQLQAAQLTADFLDRELSRAVRRG